jgi:putative PEP-CTERM system histidine kinase
MHRQHLQEHAASCCERFFLECRQDILLQPLVANEQQRMSFVAGSYLTAAAACIAAAFFVKGGAGLQRAPRIRLGMLVGAAWALLVAAHSLAADPLSSALTRLLPAGEVLRYGGLLLVLGALSSAPRDSWLQRLNLWVWCGCALVALLGAVWLDPVRTLSLVGLSLALVGLVNVEQLLRTASLRTARAVKFCVIGLGGQFAYDLFLYSQAELLGGLDVQSWALRGLVLVALIPFASIGIRRLADERPTIFVSRQVVFYTTAFLSVGIYLVAMALGGYYVRAHGGSWGESLRLLFFVGSGVVLAMLMLSQSLWRRVRVFVTKHFYRNKYDYRVEWLRFIGTLSAPDSSDARVTSIRAIAQIIESPGGALFLRGEGAAGFEMAAIWFGQQASLPACSAVAMEHDLHSFLAERKWVIDIAEYRKAPEIYRNIVLPEWLLDTRTGWRIVNPLLELDQLIGFMVLQAPPEPFQMTFEDRDLLRTVGRHVATLLAQQAADRKLTESRQFDAFNRFAAFVMHDLKNSVAQLQLLVKNAERYRHNPEFMDDAIATIGNTAARMTRLIEQLQARDAVGGARAVRLEPLLRAVTERCAVRPPGVQFEFAQGEAGKQQLAVLADADRLGAVLDHVVRNAQDAAGTAGQVSLVLASDSQWAWVAVQDNGPGMDPEFVRERLFRPFDSTKGSRGMGIGAYQTREYVRQLGGDVEVQSNPGRGTRFLIKLPLCQTSNPVS